MATTKTIQIGYYDAKTGELKYKTHRIRQPKKDQVTTIVDNEGKRHRVKVIVA